MGTINATIGTKQKLTCISRPRRFGKSYAAQMLCAYYDKNCDSHELFENYKISMEDSCRKHKSLKLPPLSIPTIRATIL